MVYCESCGEEDLDYWIEMPDGSLVCSPKCGKNWMQVIKENREADGLKWTEKDTTKWMKAINQK